MVAVVPTSVFQSPTTGSPADASPVVMEKAIATVARFIVGSIFMSLPPREARVRPYATGLEPDNPSARSAVVVWRRPCLTAVRGNHASARRHGDISASGAASLTTDGAPTRGRFIRQSGCDHDKISRHATGQRTTTSAGRRDAGSNQPTCEVALLVARHGGDRRSRGRIDLLCFLIP